MQAVLRPVAPSVVSRGVSDLSVCGRPAGIGGSHVASLRRADVIRRVCAKPTTSHVPTCLQLSAGLRLTRPDLRLHIATRQLVNAPRQGATTATATLQEATSIVKLLPPNFGYVALTAAASVCLLQWQATMVSLQRRKYGVKYPMMYENKEDSIFNCYQRAHANTLENYPQFLLMLLLSGLVYPNVATVLGSAWILGRVLYSLGYYTGEPKNRLRGGFSSFVLLGMLITTIVVGVKLVLG